MRSKFAMTRFCARAIGLCLAASFPATATATAKSPSPDETIRAAKRSPLYRGQLRRSQLRKRGLNKIEVSPGVQMNFKRYLSATGLRRRPELAPLFDRKLRAKLVDGTPRYSEEILELEDRFVIDRKLVIPLKEGVCAEPNLRKHIKQLCFTRKAKGKNSKGVAKEIARIRKRLAKAPASKIIRGKVTVGKASKMNDAQLLDMLLNGDSRTIRHVSIVPKRSVDPSPRHPAGSFAKALPKTAGVSGLEAKAPSTTLKPVKPARYAGEMTKTFGTEYFLTGFTYGKEIVDFWEYTFAGSTWLTDRYYIRLDYNLGFGFGVRAPFSVDVKAGAGTMLNSRDVQLSVKPVNVDSAGKPAYPAVNLPTNKYFGGKEFVLELKAGCRLYVSIPGPNWGRNCPSVDKSWSKDINPVLGTDTSKIGEWWLKGDTIGLGLSAGIAGAWLDIGLGADVTNGEIGMRFSRKNSTFTGLEAGNVSFRSTAPVAFKVTRSTATKGAGFVLDNPRYGFDVKLTPKLRPRIWVDVALYSNEWTLGPYALDFLSISKNVQLTRHEGTVANHTYDLFEFTAPKAKHDPGSTPPKKKPPTRRTIPASTANKRSAR